MRTMTIKSFNLACLILIMVSCGISPPGDLVIPINISEAVDLFESDVLAEISLIQLETKEESMIKGIDKLLIHDQDIFILNNAQPKNPYPQDLLRFNSKGDFISNYGKVGRGPDEHISIFDFLICNRTGQVEILTGPVNRISIYEKDGSLISQSNIIENFRAHSFSKTKSDNYVVCAGANNGFDNHRLYVLNNDGEIINRFLGQKTNLFPLSEHNFSSSTSKTFFRETFNDTIYVVDDKKIEPIQVFNFAGYNLPKEVFNLDQESFFQNINGRAIIINHFDNDQFMLVNFFLLDYEPLTAYSILKSHKTGNLALLKSPKLGTDNIESLQVPVYLSRNNDIILTIQPIELILNQELFKTVPKIHSLIDNISITELSNPIIVLARIREDF